MNRRAFLKVTIFGLAVAARLVLLAGAARAGDSVLPVAGSYGAGTYGAQAYPGFTVFAPVVARGGN